MKKYLIILSLISSLLLTWPTYAFMPTSTGKELLQYCKIAMDIHDKQFGRPQTDPEYILGTKTGICEGYLMSANETRFLTISANRAKNPSFCLPPTYNLLVGASVVVKYLEDHSDQQNLPAAFLVRRSLETYFPCMRG